MNVLVIGPSANRSKGGMSTVIAEMNDDKALCDEFSIDFYESYIDGNRIKVLFFSIYSYIKFILMGMAKKYDIYHIHAASYGSTFRKFLYIHSIKKNHKKVVFHIHGAEYETFFNSLSTKKQQKIIQVLESVDSVIALSQTWKNKFESMFGITNCFVVENGINIDKLKPAINDIKQSQHTMISLGRLGKRKGTYDLIDAIDGVIKHVRDLKIYLAGDGDVEEVQKLISIKGLDNNIEVTGWINFDQKVELLQKCSVLLLPSYNEGLPMAILESMASGKAIISTNVGAIPEVVTSDNGILINPGDVKSLENAIIELAEHDDIISEMSKNNIRKIYNNYSVNIMHEKIRNIYLNI